MTLETKDNPNGELNQLGLIVVDGVMAATKLVILIVGGIIIFTESRRQQQYDAMITANINVSYRGGLG